MIQVCVVGARDRQLEELLRACGFQPVSVGVAEVQRFALPSAKQPAAIVVDLRGDAALPPAIAAVRKQHPNTAIVLVAATLEPSLLLEAMRAGVNEVVAEPITQEELQRALGRVASEPVASVSGRVYGFVGAKGGVGTTTVAVNVATVLAGASKPGRSLLMDMHPAGGDAALFSGVEPRFSVADALENTHRLDQVFFSNLVHQGAPNLDLLAAPERPMSGVVDADRLRRLIAFATTVYQHTVIDLPRSEGVILDTLDQLDAICIIANQELATVRSASRLATTLRDRYGRDKIAVLLSRSDRQADIGYDDVEKAIGTKVAHTFPSDYRLALQALHKGKPLALENHNDLSASFKRFAYRLGDIRTEEKRPRSAGLFGRFSSR